MIDQNNRHPLSSLLFIAAAIAFILWGVSQAQSFLVSSLLSVFFAILATPLVLWLERKHFPVVVAVLLVVTGMVLILLSLGIVVGASINNFYDTLPQYQASIREQIMAFREFGAGKGIKLPEKFSFEYVSPSAVMNLTASLFTRLGAAFSNVVLIVITVTFILFEAASFPVKLRTVLGDPHKAFPQFTLFINDIKRYMVIKTLISLATGILVTIWLYILHVDFPILWGFLAFLLNYVPSLGSLIAGIPAVFLTLIQLGIGWAVLAAAGYVVINFCLDYGVEQRLMGRQLRLSTLVVFLSLIFWGSLLGPIGAVLCIPLTMTLKFAFESSESTRWVAVLLGPANMTDPIPPITPKWLQFLNPKKTEQ